MTLSQTDITKLLERNGIQLPPRLPQSELHRFVMRYLDRLQHYREIVGTHTVPLYLLESNILRARARRFKQAFEDAVSNPVSAYFAVKSNNHPDVARILLEERFGLDVSSGLELDMALGLGAEDIVFSGPGKTEPELALALKHADRVIVLIDSFGELERLKKLSESMRTDMRCGVRLAFNPKGVWRKFGIPVDDLTNFWNRVDQCSHIHLTGLQFHASWNLNADVQVEYIRRLSRILDTLPQSRLNRLTFIDIGGGYWPEQGEWLQGAGTQTGRVLEALGRGSMDSQSRYRISAISIEDFADQLGRAAGTYLFPHTGNCRLCLEPGRWIVNDAVQLIFSVVDKKAPDLVITDAGTNTVGWERFETDYFPILNLSRPALSEQRCHILGALCTPHDVWGYAYFGKDIQPGDILMIPAQGAYTYSLRQQFIKALPKLVTI